MSLCNTYDANSNLLVTWTAGATTTALSSVSATTTSAEIDCRGYNSLRIESEVTATSSGTFAQTITGSEISGGTFGQIFQNVTNTQTAVVLPSLAAVKKEIYTIQSVIPSFVKITETLSGGTGTITVKITPFNI